MFILWWREKDKIRLAVWSAHCVHRSAGPSEEILSWRRPDGLPLSSPQLAHQPPVHSHTKQQPGSPLVYCHWAHLPVGSAVRHVDTNTHLSPQLQTVTFIIVCFFTGRIITVLIAGCLALLKFFREAFSSPLVNLSVPDSGAISN